MSKDGPVDATGQLESFCPESGCWENWKKSLSVEARSRSGRIGKRPSFLFQLLLLLLSTFPVKAVGATQGLNRSRKKIESNNSTTAVRMAQLNEVMN